MRLILNIVWLVFGGLWLAFFFWNLQQRPLVPTFDPHLQEAYHHE